MTRRRSPRQPVAPPTLERMARRRRRREGTRPGVVMVVVASALPLVPDLEEAIPRPRGDRHAVLRHAEAADAVVMSREHACRHSAPRQTATRHSMTRRDATVTWHDATCRRCVGRVVGVNDGCVGRFGWRYSVVVGCETGCILCEGGAAGP